MVLMGNKGEGPSLWENTQELRSVELKQKCLKERHVYVGTRRVDNGVAAVTGPLRLPPAAVIPPGGSTAKPPPYFFFWIFLSFDLLSFSFPRFSSLSLLLLFLHFTKLFTSL